MDKPRREKYRIVDTRTLNHGKFLRSRYSVGLFDPEQDMSEERPEELSILESN